MLTARDATFDKVTGLEAGADDYLTKPFDTAELLARIRALTRRTSDAQPMNLSFGNVSLDLDSGDISCQGKSMHLSYKEFALMKIFLGSPNQTFAKEELIERVWGDDSAAEGNNVEAYISFLRKKFNFLKADIELVTIRQVGYKLALKDA
jgi:DNA-binding response OmpR family regulator